MVDSRLPKGRIGIETAVEVLGVQVDEEIRSLHLKQEVWCEGMLVAGAGILSASRAGPFPNIRREVQPLNRFGGEHRWYEAWDICCRRIAQNR